MQADPNPPRFVPTLTEVVPGEATPSDDLPAQAAVQTAAAPDIASTAAQALMQHLAPLLEQHLRAALDDALRQHLGTIVRHSLHQAVQHMQPVQDDE